MFRLYTECYLWKKLRCLMFSWLDGFNFKIKNREDKLPLSFFFQNDQITHLYIYTSYYYSFSIFYIFIPTRTSSVFVVSYCMFNIPSFLCIWSFIMWMDIVVLQIFLNIDKMQQCQNTIHACVININYVKYTEEFLQFLYVCFVYVCFRIDKIIYIVFWK